MVLGRLGLMVVLRVRSICVFLVSSGGGPLLDGLGGFRAGLLVSFEWRNWFSLPLKLVSLLTGTSGIVSWDSSSHSSWEGMGLGILGPISVL